MTFIKAFFLTFLLLNASLFSEPPTQLPTDTSTQPSTDSSTQQPTDPSTQPSADSTTKPATKPPEEKIVPNDTNHFEKSWLIFITLGLMYLCTARVSANPGTSVNECQNHS